MSLFQEDTNHVSRDLYLFGSSLGKGITVPNSITVEYVWQFLGMGTFLTPPPHPSVRNPKKVHPE